MFHILVKMFATVIDHDALEIVPWAGMGSLEALLRPSRPLGAVRTASPPPNRLIDIEDGAVRFRWKDYRPNNRQKVMAVSAEVKRRNIDWSFRESGAGAATRDQQQAYPSHELKI